MALLKFGLLVICALLVCQVTASPFAENIQAEPESAKLIKRIIVDVTGFLDVAIDGIYNLTQFANKDGIDNFQKRTVDVTVKVLTEAEKLLAKWLEQIQPQLNNDAKKVSQCLELNGMNIVQLIVSYYNLTSSCFDPALKPFILSFDPLLIDLKTLDEKVAALAPQLDKCENDVCVFGVVNEVIKDLGTIVDIVRKDIGAILRTGVTFATTALNCAKTEATNWQADSYKTFNKIATCFRSN